MFEGFRNFMDLKTTGEHDGRTAMGSEFVNDIARMLT